MLVGKIFSGGFNGCAVEAGSEIIGFGCIPCGLGVSSGVGALYVVVGADAAELYSSVRVREGGG